MDADRIGHFGAGHRVRCARPTTDERFLSIDDLLGDRLDRAPSLVRPGEEGSRPGDVFQDMCCLGGVELQMIVGSDEPSSELLIQGVDAEREPVTLRRLDTELTVIAANDDIRGLWARPWRRAMRRVGDDREERSRVEPAKDESPRRLDRFL
jgi:hypothetical protein